MTQSTISKGFIFAGLSNILGVLLFSKLFTNKVMMETQPEVMGYFGLISIILWGLAYLAVSKNYVAVPWLLLVFVVEKLVYVIVWILWMITNSVLAVYEQDAFAGAFYMVYGVNDFLFGLFFLWVFLKVKK